MDTITTQVVRHALERVADEMGKTMVRSARSTLIKEIEDLSCAIFDAEGRTIAQAPHAPILLAGFELAMREVVRQFPPEALEEGDLIITNDPYQGGQHIMDLLTFAPVFVHGQLVGWVGSVAHHQDLGGAAPGGVAGGMAEIFAEGLRFPMVKLYKAGKENDDVWRIFEANIRVPKQTFGDVRAQASSCFVGVRRVQELYSRYGSETMQAAQDALLAYSERRIRQALAEIPDGDYSGVDYIDDDGKGNGPIRIQVTIRKRGRDVIVDFDGTDGQTPGNVNCPLASTYAAVYYAIIGVVDPGAPPNAGCYRPIQIVAEPGTVVNPTPPAALAARSQCAGKVTEAVLRAFAGIVPDRVMAGSHGQITNCALSGYDAQGRRWIFTDINVGGAGARPIRDGRDGQDSHLFRQLNTPIESAEVEYPIRFEEYGFVPDTGGAGRFRGALAMVRSVRVLTDNVTLARYADRHLIGPFGLFGGHEGGKGSIELLRSGEPPKVLPSKGIDYLNAGDVLRVTIAGGGGYGRPEERSREAVLADVRGGKVSAAVARDVYKVDVAAVAAEIEL